MKLTLWLSGRVTAHDAGGFRAEPVGVTLAASPDELLAPSRLRVEAPATEVTGARTALDWQFTLIWKTEIHGSNNYYWAFEAFN